MGATGRARGVKYGVKLTQGAMSTKRNVSLIFKMFSFLIINWMNLQLHVNIILCPEDTAV